MLRTPPMDQAALAGLVSAGGSVGGLAGDLHDGGGHLLDGGGDLGGLVGLVLHAGGRFFAGGSDLRGSTGDLVPDAGDLDHHVVGLLDEGVGPVA